MRTESAATAKSRKHHHKNQREPAYGTVLRGLWDLFHIYRGEVIEIPKKSSGSSIYQLQDFYGLDILKVSRRKYILAGEWFGSKYHDYIAQKLNKKEGK